MDENTRALARNTAANIHLTTSKRIKLTVSLRCPKRESENSDCSGRLRWTASAFLRLALEVHAFPVVLEC